MGGVGPIPATSLLNWFRQYGINDLGDQQLYRACFRAMDKVMMHFMNARNSNQSGGRDGALSRALSNPHAPPLTKELFDQMFSPSKSLKKVREK